MKKTGSKRRNVTPRMEWYLDEVPEEGSTEHLATGKETKEGRTLVPHMEYYFDEITETKYTRCPLTGRKATVEVVRRASRDDTPFVDIAYCSIFGCAPTCDMHCLKRINYMKHFHK